VKDVWEFIICQRNSSPDSNARGKGYLIDMKLGLAGCNLRPVPGFQSQLQGSGCESAQLIAVGSCSS
jgi:hypothetical protein